MKDRIVLECAECNGHGCVFCGNAPVVTLDLVEARRILRGEPMPPLSVREVDRHRLGLAEAHQFETLCKAFRRRAP